MIDPMNIELGIDTQKFHEGIDAAIEKIKKLQAVQNTGLMGKVFSAFAGRTTFFAFAIFVSGTILSWFGKLNTEYVALCGVIQTLVCFHSIKEDYHERQTQGQAQSQAQSTTVIVNTDADDKKAQ